MDRVFVQQTKTTDLNGEIFITYHASYWFCRNPRTAEFFCPAEWSLEAVRAYIAKGVGRNEADIDFAKSGPFMGPGAERMALDAERVAQQTVCELTFNKKHMTLTINRYDYDRQHRTRRHTYQTLWITAASWRRIREVMARPDWPVSHEDDAQFHVSSVRAQS